MKRWRLWVVLLCALWGILMVLPTFLTPSAREKIPSWLPQRQMTLGLDLNGGVHLLLEVDTAQYIGERCQSIAPFLRTGMLKEKILYRNLKSEKNGASMILVHPKDIDRLKQLAQKKQDFPLNIIVLDHGKVQIEMPDSYRLQLQKDIVNRSMEIIRKRIDKTGALEPIIHEHGGSEKTGTNRIILQIPGFDDPQRVRDLLGKTAKLTFHWVGSDNSWNDSSICTKLPLENSSKLISVEKVPVMSGEEILSSNASYQPTGDTYGVEKPAVKMELTSAGQSIFSELTRPKNHNRLLAIVLDGEILSTPLINQHIPHGSPIISGSMSMEEAQQLATMINSGALPAPLSILEEKVIGPGLGNDSIVAGTRGTLLAIVSVAVWMLMTYAYFGFFAVLGIAFNLLFLVAILILLGATLTLPGLAGIALTVGMSVDANVLINERIKEEWHKGNSISQSIAQGYDRAMGSILDSNFTTLIGAFILYLTGSGPIRGFAVTMGIGILISLFTAIGLTRMLVLEWIQSRNPQRLSI